MLYRPMDGFGASDTTLVHALHDMALSIHMAKKAGNQAAANALYDQFVQIAEQYRANGGNEAWLAKLINAVHDSVIATTQEAIDVAGRTVEQVADIAGKSAANALNPLKGIILPLALVAGLIYFGPMLLKRRAT